jgi:16S rRNA (adenine1518-N6/adenine1519-N6)-dimethyltransferase
MIQAKKSLGQHFLKSKRALALIVEAGEVTDKDTVLEIGPGKGALTEKLLASGCQLIAVEKDDELLEFLKQKFAKEIVSGQLTLIRDDIMNFEPLSHKLGARSYKLVANIPYNITGAILKKFLGAERQPKNIVLLVQKEVAERISRERKESILSLSVKAYGEPRYVETVKAGSFVPSPQVDSAIIAITNISKNFFKDVSEKEFFEIVHVGFKSKRKKLSSNLTTIWEKGSVSETFSKLKLNENLRAEDVNIETWQKIAKNLIQLEEHAI